MSTFDVNPPYTTGGTRTDDLSEDHARQGLCILLRDRSCDGHGSHRSREREGGDDHHLVACRILHDSLDHRDVEAQRRRSVDDRVHRRFGIELLVRHLPCDPDHLEAIPISLPAQAVGVEHLVAQRQQVMGCMEVPHGRMDVGWFDWISAVHVDRVHVLAEPDEVLEIRAISRTSTPACAGHVRWTGDRSEDHVVATDSQVVGRVSGVESEF